MDNLEKKKSRVLTVDDEPNNLSLVRQILRGHCEISFAINGFEALETALNVQPDLILLDVMMPEMDGYEVCRRLKSNPATKKIPVIFVTSMDEEKDERSGFDVGGVDYITKPIQPSILQARVRTHLKLRSALDELEKQNRIIGENARLRGDIEQITRHDLRGVLTAVIGCPDLIRAEGHLSEKQQKHLNNIVRSGYKMLSMINLSADMYKMEKGIYQFKPVLFDVLPILADISDEHRNLIQEKQLSVRIMLNGSILNNIDEFFVSGDKLLFYSMLSNITKNALEASPEGEEIKILLENENQVNIRIHNVGVVPRQIRDRFFDKFVTAGKEKGTGLGTYSARLIAETQGGTVQVKTSEFEGTEVTFSFPL